jgi:hypothetical protein
MISKGLSKVKHKFTLIKICENLCNPWLKKKKKRSRASKNQT